jgi:acyl dehydratase/NAD(P)-dependent dehydrogenase (short-subunit alcohol dehydrogenase family)
VTREASFDVDVTVESARQFAQLSGDWNPLHTDSDYACWTPYGHIVLHGAFSAGLISRLAGMHLPGKECLLHGMRLRFVAPIIPPASLRVTGRRAGESGEVGRVDATVSDVRTGVRYVEASYEFGRHEQASAAAHGPSQASPASARDTGEEAILITGATGGLGRAVLSVFGPKAVGLSRQLAPSLEHTPDPESLEGVAVDQRIAAIVHCGWPAPDNTRLIALSDPRASVEHYVAAPLRQCLALARLLAARGTDDALLVLVGSTAVAPGRHNFRMPLYSLGKALLPTLTQILAVELGATGRRIVTVVFDVLETGMNQRLSRAARQSHADRSPTGRLASAEEAAAQVAWVVANRSFLASGATITLSGGALP